jgi:hypothetical protein
VGLRCHKQCKSSHAHIAAPGKQENSDQTIIGRLLHG